MSFGRRLGIVAAGALALRLLYIFVVSPAPVGVGGDAGFYHSAANLIASGHFYYREIFGHAHKTAEHPPLFPLLLSLASLVGGKGLIVHRVLGCVVGVVTVVLIGQLGAMLAGERAGLLAAAIAAVYPPLVTADGLVMSEPLFTAMVAAALLLALRLRARPTAKGALLLGLAIGLATLTRAEGLLLIPLLAWPAAFIPGPGRARRMIAATLAAALVVSPWVVRNAVVFHRAILSTDENTLLAGANCHDTYYGHDIGWWSPTCMTQARSPAQVDAGDASTDAALHYAGSHVGRLPLVAAVRVLRTFDLFQPLRQGNHEPRRQWVDIVGLCLYYPLLVLAGFGLARIPGRRWLLLAPVNMVVIVSALGWGIGRFRVGADISIVVLAAIAFTGWVKARREAPATAGAGRPRRLRAPAQAA